MKPTVSHLVRWKKMHVSLQSHGWPSSSLLKDSGADTEVLGQGEALPPGQSCLSLQPIGWLHMRLPPNPPPAPLASLQPWEAGTS